MSGLVRVLLVCVREECDEAVLFYERFDEKAHEKSGKLGDIYIV
jgi:hypothetical protein